MKIPSLRRLTFLLLIVTPALAWFAVKPVRVLLPHHVGVRCVSVNLCLENMNQQEAAQALYTDAVRHVAEVLAPIQGQPKVIFCATSSCDASFGLGARYSVAIGKWGIVIGSRGWKPSFVRHELIHYVQAEKIGVISLLFKPAWFVEGMAYALSEDERAVLPQPYDAQRKQFKAWFNEVGKADVWSASS